jgi:hypothetical protein
VPAKAYPGGRKKHDTISSDLGQPDGALDRFQAVVAVPHGLGPVPVEASLGHHVEERLTNRPRKE